LDRSLLAPPETVPSHLAAGRVLAAPAVSRLRIPPADISLRDGFALRAADTAKASPEAPARLTLNRDCLAVFTGQNIPRGFDAVVMNEDIRLEGETVAASAPVASGAYVRSAGRDASPGRAVLFPNHVVAPRDIAGLLTAGVYEVLVHPRPKAVFIPTGDELLAFARRPAPGEGQAVESNSQVFLAMAAELGVAAASALPVRDDPNAIRAAAQSALDGGAHLVAIGAGSSFSGRDHSRTVIESMGRVLSHGLAVHRGRLLACVPGPPPSSAAFCEEILAPILAWFARRSLPAREVVQARLARDIDAGEGWLEAVRVQLAEIDDRFIARPLSRAAGAATGLCRTQALMRLPPEPKGLAEGDVVDAELLVPAEEIRRGVLLVGRDHPALDRLAAILAERDAPLQLLCDWRPDREALADLQHGRAHAACVAVENAPPDACAATLAPGLVIVVTPEARQAQYAQALLEGGQTLNAAP
jgi:putative molybdopterin biosynthesis protein